MKHVKTLIVSFFLILAIAYLAFLFVLPNCIDFNKFAPEFINSIKNSTGIKVYPSGIKVKTNWKLDVGIHVDRTDLISSDGEKFAQINDFQTDFYLLPLLFKDFKIDNVSAGKLFINLKTNKNGDVLLLKNINNTQEQKLPYNFKFSNSIPNISVKKYRISFLNKNNTYSLKGQNLEISDFILSENIKLKTQGFLAINEHKQILYDVSVKSKSFSSSDFDSKNLIKIFEDLLNYKIKSKILADLSIDEKGTFGKIYFDKLSFVFDNRLYPESSVKLGFKQDKVKINAGLHVDKNSKAVISGIIKTGKNKFVDLDVHSDEVQIEDILHITRAISRTFGLKQFKDINAKGIMKAQFSLKSDFKKIESNGFLKIKNASLTDKKYNALMNSINADIDFSKDSIRIKKAGAKLNSQPIIINGSIDKNAFANISVSANNLPLKGLLLSLGQFDVIKENNISSGLVNVQANLIGQLNKTKPNISANINNINLKNLKSKTKVNAKSIVISAQNNIANIHIMNLKVLAQNGITVNIPQCNSVINQNTLLIPPIYLYINGVKTILSGQVVNLKTKPTLNAVHLNLPKNITLPIKGYYASKMVADGGLTINGDIYNPQITGTIKIPIISVPSYSTLIQNANVEFGNTIKLTCPSVKLANSEITITSNINKDFSKGIILENTKFNADLVDINTIAPLLKTASGNSGINIQIKDGQSSVNEFKYGNMMARNVKSKFSMNSSSVTLNDLFANAYGGKIAGNINYNISHKKLNLDIQGRGLSSNAAITGLISRNEDINGILDFDGNVSMSGNDQNEILKNLNGNLNFIISNGKMGLLGEFEHLIYAQNVLSNNIFKTTLNVVAKAITVKNTGVYKYMKGKIHFSNGYANIDWVKTSGPSMSLYVTGKYYMPFDIANLTMLGRISDDVVRILGPIGEFSMDKAISSIPKLGEISSYFASQYTSNPTYENISEIPPLNPQTEFGDKEFKVIIDGNIHSQNAVKSFKWLSKPKIVRPTPVSKPKTYAVPDFVKKLPNLK